MGSNGPVRSGHLSCTSISSLGSFDALDAKGSLIDSNEMVPMAVESRRRAQRLVGALDGDELLVLSALVRGMSVQAIAASSTDNLEDFEHYLASLMAKLRAKKIADAVRIGLYAGVDRRD